MTKLYRITPIDKKSVNCYYEVYQRLSDDTFKTWNVTELYRWGQGFKDIDDRAGLPPGSRVDSHPDAKQINKRHGLKLATLDGPLMDKPWAVGVAENPLSQTIKP